MTHRALPLVLIAILLSPAVPAAVIRSLTLSPTTGHAMRQEIENRRGQVILFPDEEVDVAVNIWSRDDDHPERSLRELNWTISEVTGKPRTFAVIPLGAPKRTYSGNEGTIEQQYRIEGLTPGQYSVAVSLPRTPDARAAHSYPAQIWIALGDENPAVREAFLDARLRRMNTAHEIAYTEYKALVQELRKFRPHDLLLVDQLADVSLGRTTVEETRQLYSEAARLATDATFNGRKLGSDDPIRRLVDTKQRKYRAFERLYPEYITQQSAATINLVTRDKSAEGFVLRSRTDGRVIKESF